MKQVVLDLSAVALPPTIRTLLWCSTLLSLTSLPLEVVNATVTALIPTYNPNALEAPPGFPLVLHGGAIWQREMQWTSSLTCSHPWLHSAWDSHQSYWIHSLPVHSHCLPPCEALCHRAIFYTHFSSFLTLFPLHFSRLFHSILRISIPQHHTRSP